MFALLDWTDDLDWFGRLDSLALLQIKDGVVAQQNRFAIFRFSCLLVLLPVFVDLPEDNLGALLALLDASAQCLGIGAPSITASALSRDTYPSDRRLRFMRSRFFFLPGIFSFSPTKARVLNLAVERWFHQPSIRSSTADHDSCFVEN